MANLNMNGINVKNAVVPLTLACSMLVMAVLGGMAWGQQKEAFNSHLKLYLLDKTAQALRDRGQDNTLSTINVIQRDQAVMQLQLKNLDEKQEQFRDDMNVKLNIIIRQLGGN